MILKIYSYVLFFILLVLSRERTKDEIINEYKLLCDVAISSLQNRLYNFLDNKDFVNAYGIEKNIEAINAKKNDVYGGLTQSLCCHLQHYQESPTLYLALEIKKIKRDINIIKS